ncbi:NAD(P)-binding protein [Acrodontium crateriforme]|uniref:NAD(P)-binding protein n=1 Tax=Acrodontium crateriforme TaxID=150365 RepID=A0AAQ3M0C5_9PEZI|nr:NAD(P)-binding protein [Acrodontium crateriforme]
MANPKPITIAIIGVGGIGPRHATSIAKCPDARLISLVDPSPHAAELAHKLNVPLYTGVDELLTSPETAPDAVYVCTPNSTHVSISKRLLAAGVHVLVEKPLSTTIESGRELVEAAAASHAHLLVGHHRRFNAYITAAKQSLKAIGRPIAVSGLWVTCKPASYFEAPAEWRAKAGNGGPILINLIHEVDILQYLLGPIVRVHAEATISQRGHEVEEGAAILLRFASGAVGTFILSDATPSNHNFESATGENPMVPYGGHDIYRIFGTEGTLSVGDMKISKHDVEKSWTRPLNESDVSVGDEVPFDEQVKHLVRVIRGEEQPRCTGEDGLRALIVCDAIQKALATEAAVDIKDDKL